MSKEFSIKNTLIYEAYHPSLDSYPKSCKYTLEFDGTDMTVYGYVEQFRAYLRMMGFAEKSIKEALGEF